MKNRPIDNYSVEMYQAAADYILERAGTRPDIGLVLGSALGNLAQLIENPVIIPYAEIPNFLTSTVASHAGQLILGTLEGKRVMCMSGRFHYYEGYDFEDLVIPMRVMQCCGVQTVILTNAAGAINESYRPGDIMIISDHLKLTGASPLRGPNREEFGPRFFDVSDLYTKRLRGLVRTCGENLGLSLREGVYYFAVGPQFETPAEIRAMRILGADAVGMSTVTEALTCGHMGMDLIALSLITNMAAGVLDQPVTGEEVDETGRRSAADFSALIREIVSRLE
ncbi:purine-nucleoside phosphorylase [Proteiniclasticum sp. QWL-01]|uniref:purine-nucleoside phosphorylase n=1 Tax=Proteiniclasticum sp. QWL-01 TaxID=3036945 RepID=UPI00220E15C2|nr:purine-nucleoside phosphorylase [Proteiniclasticum sp. QWL-01]UUM11095.1 purine-nucleoside phosphorylase [Clostridiaceae bacterium HFYG-1003]WFF72423.1 purine-nucleoside phosphorylase [Proteiniclasticum sp. QWL-01]